MDFIARVKAIRADVGKQEMTITFSVRLDDESLAAAKELAPYTSEDAGDVELDITPRQHSFLQTTEVVLTHPIK